MKIALVGNQNCGKTTLFNLLTGTNQKIGNWPGVTIERKIGTIKGTENTLVDLPGIYSLSPYTVEEEISRKFILEEKPNLIINVIDGTALERSLYLTTQLMELNIKVIVVLNMQDRLEAKGIYVDMQNLSKKISTDVVAISALKGIGIKELKDLIKTSEGNKVKTIPIFKSEVENEILKIENMFNVNRFVAIKILENDKFYKKYQTKNTKNIRTNLEQKLKMDIEEIIANERYNYITKIVKDCTKIKFIKETTSDKLDKIFLNKFLALPIFIMIMFLIYYLSVGVIGKHTTDFVSESIQKFGEIIRIFLLDIKAPVWIVSLVIDGILQGVGAVLGFVPQLTILFLCISILETTGYMSRVAFLLDRLFKKFGLNGQSIIPFIVGLRM